MPKLVARISILCALFAVIAAVSGCGGSVPSDSVAQVGDTSITKEDFNHRLLVTYLSSQGQTGKADPKAMPAPPDFKGCIAAAKKNAPKPAKGQPQVTDATYKKQCEATYKQLHDSVLQTLIQGDWIAGEAKEQGIKVDQKAIDKQFNTLKKQQFPKEADYQKFLKQSGLSEDDLKENVRLQLLTNKLRTKIVSGKTPVTKAQIAAYYKKNKATFGQQEHRALRIVLNKNKAKAAAALKALKSGGSWKSVAKKYSTDPTSKDNGGVLASVTKGQEDPGLDKAVFAAKKGDLHGPVKTPFGYYVFQVSGVTPAVQQSVGQATPSIKQILESQAQQTKLNKFVTGFQKKWTKKTSCHKGDTISVCKNFKAPKTTTPTPGATGPAEPAAPSTTG
jgi:parvulin-like peptidyl-prolyl isomerase